MRIVELEQWEGEEGVEQGLRPTRLEEYIGQRPVVENLKVFIQAARRRGEPLDHMLLFGPPGLGKTTLAQIVASEFQANLRRIGAPMLEKGGDLAALLTTLQPGDVLFIDEIHRLRPQLEELLYSAIEDFKLDIVVGSGPAAQTVEITLPRFTLIGATTRIGLISPPLRDRFGIQFRLNFYSVEELVEILKRGAARLGIGATPDGLEEIARRARGTPRIGLRLLRRLRDFAEVEGKGVLDREIADRGLRALGIGPAGLDQLDRRLLEILKEARGPVGLGTLAAILGEDPGTIEEVIEPYLLAEGYIEKGPKGRSLTRKGWEVLRGEKWGIG